jgi:hypothetical protein
MGENPIRETRRTNYAEVEIGNSRKSSRNVGLGFGVEVV